MKEQRNISDEEVDDIILCVHSGSNAAVDRLKIKNVNQKYNPVEFIFSVSMLTEGWDVKRVFQIVPDEERAFNSKLLIAQVLGRGLRVPDDWRMLWGTPVVRVFNHEKWSSNVKSLVDEILQIRQTISTRVNPDSIYNFEVLNVEYTKKEDAKKFPKFGSYNLWEDGVKLPTDEMLGKSTIIFENVKDSVTTEMLSTYTHQIFTVDEVTDTLYHRVEDIPDKTFIPEYQALWTKEKISEMIQESLSKSSNKVITKSLRNKLLSSMSVIFRDTSKVVTYTTFPTEYFEVSTKKLPNNTNDLTRFFNNCVLYYSSDFEGSLTDDSSKVSYKEISDSSNRFRVVKIDNKFNFKTPQFGIVTTGTPEKKFLDKLINPEISNSINSFIKSDDMSFYKIEYVWRKGSHHQNGHFNPDWFIKQDDLYIIVETKDDSQLSDPDPENIGKNKAAIAHFKQINEHLKSQGKRTRYKFNFLTPKNYDIFFNRLISGDAENYISDLDIKLDE